MKNEILGSPCGNLLRVSSYFPVLSRSADISAVFLHKSINMFSFVRRSNCTSRWSIQQTSGRRDHFFLAWARRGMFSGKRMVEHSIYARLAASACPLISTVRVFPAAELTTPKWLVGALYSSVSRPKARENRSKTCIPNLIQLSNFILIVYFLRFFSRGSRKKKKEYLLAMFYLFDSVIYLILTVYFNCLIRSDFI